MPHDLDHAIEQAEAVILSQQATLGYWWYALEANESITAEYLIFHKYMGIALEPWRIQGLIERLLSQQRPDGSWAIYFDGPGSVGATVECYFALKLYGISAQDPAMLHARSFILSQGGALKSWIFTRIHLAMFGLIPWDAVPEMPIAFILLPKRSRLSLYQFSSWARASMVPLLVIMDHKKTVHCEIDLDELFLHSPTSEDWQFETDTGRFSLEQIFISLDRLFKKTKFPEKLRAFSRKRCERWIIEHLQVTEDIFPALMYGAIALHLLGHDHNSPIFSKALKALASFQMACDTDRLPALPEPASSTQSIYQQCCISPTWDTAWAGTALIHAGLDPNHPALVKAAEWLLSMQVTAVRGDWAIKNPKAKPGGWGFEFENASFPDIDDTIQIMQFLQDVPLDESLKQVRLKLALDWVMSMQCKNGGWAAFDKDNTRTWVNRIPFSDHKACLDPPTADITARVIETATRFGYTLESPEIARALLFIQGEQTEFGAWPGRWGVHYLYGTWCVLHGLTSSGIDKKDALIERAIGWLTSVQNADGGFGESCESYDRDAFVPLGQSTASQTSWAILSFVACGLERSSACTRAVKFLLSTQKTDGTWDESAYTGTGFPKHFYIRYHGYRHYFPLLALGAFRNALLKRVQVG